MKKKDIALLTPLLLAINPVTVAAKDFTYDHEKQLSVTEDGVEAYSTMNSTTWNGTQTYDYQGKPWDNDNDTDEDPY